MIARSFGGHVIRTTHRISLPMPRVCAVEGLAWRPKPSLQASHESTAAIARGDAQLSTPVREDISAVANKRYRKYKVGFWGVQ
jgi:hypothetical protein